MIRVVIEVDKDELRTEVSTRGISEEEVGLLLLGLQQAKKEVMKEWGEHGAAVGKV